MGPPFEHGSKLQLADGGIVRASLAGISPRARRAGRTWRPVREADAARDNPTWIEMPARCRIFPTFGSSKTVCSEKGLVLGKQCQPFYFGHREGLVGQSSSIC